MTSFLFVICFFTFLIHLTECLAYVLRLSGVRAKQLAISLSFVTSTLLVSRLSNMFQAPLLGSMVDTTILTNSPAALENLILSFRYIIFAGAIGTAIGMLLTPYCATVFQKAIDRFKQTGSLIGLLFRCLNPIVLIKLLKLFRLPKLEHLKQINLNGIPKTFLIMNIFVTSIYTIGVLCALLAGAYLPEFRSTAIQLSGIVNGMATILLTLIVDPSGARITDQAYHSHCSEETLKSVIFFLQLGKLVGTLILAQLLLKPLTHYILVITQWISGFA